ncbi:MAG: hypothetical protein CFE45_36270, partial [Burkholderiales bacterium PBB5]
MAAADPPADPARDLNEALQLSLLRAFFGTVAGVCLVGSLAVPVFAPQLDLVTRVAMALAYGCLGLASAFAARMGQQRAGQVMPAVVLIGIVVVASVAVASGWGLQTPGLLFFGMVVCMANALPLGRLGLLSTALTVGVVVALGVAER